MSKNKTILVTGATGQQGGATARQLLKRGYAVKALVRDKSTVAARAIESLGAQLTEGDLDRPDTLKKALQGVDAVFLVTAAGPHIPKEREVNQGKNLAAQSKEAAVSHFVFTSSIGSAHETGVPFLDSKREIEQYLNQSGLPLTILRPGAFMENFKNMWLQGDRLYAAFRPTSALAVISARDIGEFAAIAFDKPSEFIGKTFNLAVDMRTPAEVADAFSRLLGRNIKFVEQPLEEVRQFNEGLARMFERLRDVPASALAEQIDIERLRQINPTFWTVEEWIKQTYSVEVTGLPSFSA